MAVTLRSYLEQDFQVEVPLSAVGNSQTLEHLERTLSKIIKVENSSPLSERSNEECHKNVCSTVPFPDGSLEVVPKIIHCPADRYKSFPLSEIQESFLTGRKLCIGGDWVGCHIYLEIETQGVDIYRLNSAWERLIDYHEMLRSVISSDGRQKILEKRPRFKIKIIDLRGENDNDRSRLFKEERRKMSHVVYEVESWPLFEICISVWPKGKQIIHFSIDEFVVDASGLEMLLLQWQHLYINPDFELPGLDLSFRDYTIAVNKFQDSERYKKDLDYWLTTLENMAGGPALPLHSNGDLVSQKEIYFRSRMAGELTAEQWTRLKERATKIEVSPTTLLLTVFSEVLRSWCDQTTFSLILTFFNRLPLHPQINQLLGPFISTNIFVIKARQNEDLERTMQKNQERLWQDLDHSSVSGIKVLRELKKGVKFRVLYPCPLFLLPC